MRLLLALLVLAGAAWGQTPQHRLFEQPNLPHSGLAFFEAFPASGAGAGAACACSAVTGAKGEALTFSRASTQTCTKTVGTEPQAIASGDLVSCALGQSAVMPGADGTSIAGLLVEVAATNLVNRSEKLDNLYWSGASTGVAVPTVTGDYLSQSPFASPPYSYAERVELPATTAGQSSYIYAAPFSAVAESASLYAKGVSAGGTLDVCIQTGASTYTCTACAYLSATWTRCKREGVTSIASGRIAFGHMTEFNGGLAHAASDVLLTAVQGEAGAMATSYVPTDATTANRVATVATATLTSALGPNFSAAASFTVPSASTPAGNILFLGSAGAGNNLGFYRLSDTSVGWQIGATSTSATPSSLGSAGHRITLSDSSGIRSASLDGTSYTAPAASLSAGQTALYIGANVTSSTPLQGVVKSICIDPSPSRCR